MAKITQDEQSMSVNTPLGKDAVLIDQFSGVEQISNLFEFKLHLLAQPETDVQYDKLLGQVVTVKIDYPEGFGEKARYYSGIVNKLRECGQERSASEGAYYIRYEATVVPELWLLTKRKDSRIFQQKTVVDIIKETLGDYGIKFKDEIQGEFDKLNYCVQYNETDFDFVNRLMEENGIYYFFKFSDGSHEMVFSNNPNSITDAPGGDVSFWDSDNEGSADTNVVYQWEKSQIIHTGKVTLWDHHFEMPLKNLEANKETLASVETGTVTHKLNVANNTNLEAYEYPGRYEKYHDGIDPGGADQASELEKLFQVNTKMASVRMGEQHAHSIDIVGKGQCHQFSAGHKFKLKDHFNANGQYYFTKVEFAASMKGVYTTNVAQSLSYSNTFHCAPIALAYVPIRRTPKPMIKGAQTALVVGPGGQEIFTDKYGRVKVQFHWDRVGKKDASSSCWIRVATSWAGKSWGSLNVPRIGHEVVVHFLEGDPDRPLIIGSVYNADNMPPYMDEQGSAVDGTHSGVKSRSTLKGGEENYNEIRMQDLKEEELFYMHAEKDMVRVVEDRDVLLVNSKSDITGKSYEALLKDTKKGSQTLQVEQHRTETVMEGDETVTIKKGKRSMFVDEGDDLHHIKKGKRTLFVDEKDDLHQIKKGHRTILVDTGNSKLTIAKGNQDIKLSAGQSTTDAAKQILLKVGSNSIKIDTQGITISGAQIKVSGTATAEMSSPATKVSGSGTLTLSGGIVNIN